MWAPPTVWIYAHTAVSPHTEHAKGCAFTPLTTQQAVHNCLKAASPEKKCDELRENGQQLKVALAMTHPEAIKVQTKKGRS